MPSNRVKLEICGSSYVVSTTDTEEYLVGLAQRLDEDMRRMMMETPNASVTAAAVITALGYLDEAEKNAMGADNMRTQIQDYLEDAAKARLAAEEARREVERLRREVSYYEKREGKPPVREPVHEKESLLDLGEAGKEVDVAPNKDDVLHIEGQMGLDEF